MRVDRCELHVSSMEMYLCYILEVIWGWIGVRSMPLQGQTSPPDDIYSHCNTSPVPMVFLLYNNPRFCTKYCWYSWSRIMTQSLTNKR